MEKKKLLEKSRTVRLLETRFFKVPDEPRAWYSTILWWELRRIPYNAIVIGSMTMGLVGFALTVEGWFDFISPPLFPVFFVLLFSNMFYTGGWVVEAILRVAFNYKRKEFASRALLAGIVFSICVAFVPAFIGFVALVSGKKIISEYAKFTEIQPSISDLVGAYELIGTGRSYLINSSDSLRHPRIVLHETGTFEYFEIPWKEQDSLRSIPQELRGFYRWRFDIPEFYFNFSDAVFLSGEGTWELKSGSAYDARSTWRLNLSFDQPPNYPHLSDKVFFRNPSYRFDVQGDQAPHDLYYVMGDYDSMEGLIFRKTDSSP